MITDAIVDLLVGIFGPVLDVLPEGHLTLPSPAGLGQALASLDGLIPILGVLRLAVVLLSLLGVFVLVRCMVFLRYLLLP